MIEHIIGAALEVAADNDRELSVQRPSRSVSAIRRASDFGKWRPFATCVLARESGATPDRRQSGVGARNPSSSASGRWQMLDASGWRTGGSWNVYKRLVRFGVPKADAREVRSHLAGRPIASWHGIWQDIAALETLDAGGWRHWYAPGSRGNGLVAR